VIQNSAPNQIEKRISRRLTFLLVIFVGITTLPPSTTVIAADLTNVDEIASALKAVAFCVDEIGSPTSSQIVKLTLPENRKCFDVIKTDSEGTFNHNAQFWPGTAIQILEDDTRYVAALTSTKFRRDGKRSSHVTEAHAVLVTGSRADPTSPRCAVSVPQVGLDDGMYTVKLELRRDLQNGYFGILESRGGDAGAHWGAIHLFHFTLDCFVVHIREETWGQSSLDEEPGCTRGTALGARFTSSNKVELSETTFQCEKGKTEMSEKREIVNLVAELRAARKNQ
jgi:hypothetical protein